MTQLRSEVQMVEATTSVLVEWQRRLALTKADPGVPTTPTESTPQWGLVYQALTIATAAGNLASLENDEEAWRNVQATVEELIEMTKSAKMASVLELGRLIQAGEETPAANPEEEEVR
jgi:hypothetical protein